MNKHLKKLALTLACMTALKAGFIAISYFFPNFSMYDLLTSILNTKNIVFLTNESRKSENLKELKISKKLEAAAQKKAEDMLSKQYFSHVSPNGKTPWEFMEDAGYDYVFAGENLAINFVSAEEVISGWLTSPSHKENILDEKYTEIGIGVAKGIFLGANTTAVVQMFGSPIKKYNAKKQKLTKNKVAYLGSNSVFPNVKGVSVSRYINQLTENHQAVWNKNAKLNQIFGWNSNFKSTAEFLDAFYFFLTTILIGVLIYLFLRKKIYKNKIISGYVFGLLIALVALSLI